VVKRTVQRPYPSDESLTRAAVELCREYPAYQERILRGLDLARAGGVPDTSGEAQDALMLTVVNGHACLYSPGTPYLGWVCGCPDHFFGASTREAADGETPGGFEPHSRWCKHLWSIRVVADSRVWASRAQRQRRPRPVQLLDVDPQTLRLVA